MIELKNTVSITNCAAVGDVIGTSSHIGGILGQGFGGDYRFSVVLVTSHVATHYNSSHTYSSTYYYYYEDGKEMRSTIQQNIPLKEKQI